jgi:hypothetical protein
MEWLHPSLSHSLIVNILVNEINSFRQIWEEENNDLEIDRIVSRFTISFRAYEVISQIKYRISTCTATKYEVLHSWLHHHIGSGMHRSMLSIFLHESWTRLHACIFDLPPHARPHHTCLLHVHHHVVKRMLPSSNIVCCKGFHPCPVDLPMHVAAMHSLILLKSAHEPTKHKLMGSVNINSLLFFAGKSKLEFICITKNHSTWLYI